MDYLKILNIIKKVSSVHTVKKVKVYTSEKWTTGGLHKNT